MNKLYLSELGLAYGAGHNSKIVIHKLVVLISRLPCECGKPNCTICMCKQVVKERGV